MPSWEAHGVDELPCKSGKVAIADYNEEALGVLLEQGEDGNLALPLRQLLRFAIERMRGRVGAQLRLHEEVRREGIGSGVLGVAPGERGARAAKELGGALL